MADYFVHKKIDLKQLSKIQNTSKTSNQNNRYKYYFFVILLITLAATYQLFQERELKKAREIEQIKTKKYKYDNDTLCEQYALVASHAGYFPCYQTNCEQDTIWLNFGEIWKYGKTCFPENRYSENELLKMNLLYRVQFSGTEKSCLIEEKIKIYAYPTLPESQARKIKLLRPPGNKIDR